MFLKFSCVLPDFFTEFAKYHDCRNKRLYGIYFLTRLMLHVKVWPISYLSDVRELVGYISLLSISFSSL